VEPKDGVHLTGFAVNHLANDSNLLEHLIICKMYKQRGKAFYLPKSFAQDLSRVDRATPTSVLPDRFLGYFQFAEGSIKDENDWVEGGYVYIGPANEIGLKVEEGPANTRVAALSYVNAPSEHGISAVGRLTFALENKKLAELSPVEWKDITIFEPSMRREEMEKHRLPVFQALINAAVYIHTEDPDLVRLPAEQELSNKKRSDLRQKTGAENLCTVPITLINKDYHHEREFSVDATTVRGHLRWQPCGSGRTQVKLIWIDEHERKYH